MRRVGMWQVWGAGEVLAGFWWGRTEGKTLLKDLGVDRNRVLK
jgi:hypothetical protein